MAVSPGRYPKLCCRYKESSNAGEDVFLKFSAFIKNPNPAFNESTPVSAAPQPPGRGGARQLRLCVLGLWKKFHSTLEKLNAYLETPLPCELDENPDVSKSPRRFLDGDTLTLADCNLLPKLHVVKVPQQRPPPPPPPPTAACCRCFAQTCEPSGGVSGILHLRHLRLRAAGFDALPGECFQAGRVSLHLPT